MINYEVTVVTGDVWAGGTNANVFLQIYGEEGKTELIRLKSRSNNFERGTTEIFRVSSWSEVYMKILLFILKAELFLESGCLFLKRCISLVDFRSRA